MPVHYTTAPCHGKLPPLTRTSSTFQIVPEGRHTDDGLE